MMRVMCGLRSLLACWIVAVGANSLWGANVKVEVISAEPYTEFTTLHSTLSLSQPTGAVEKYIPAKGSSLWLITYQMTPEWDESSDYFSLEYDLWGVFDGETRMTHYGSMYYFGIIGTSHGFGSGHSRSNDWKTKPTPGVRNRILVEIPDGKTGLVLRVVTSERDPKKFDYVKKSHETPLKLKGTATKPFDIHEFVEVKVEAAKLIESIEVKPARGEAATPTTVVNEGGSLLELTVQLTPKKTTDVDGQSFSWEPGILGLSFGKGGHAVCMGRQSNGMFLRYGEHMKPSADGKFSPQTLTIYYPVPSNLKTFDVTSFGQKVATGEVK